MKKLNKDGWYKDTQRIKYYTSPSEKKREALKVAVVRERRRRVKQEKKLEYLDTISYKSGKKRNNNRKPRR